MCVSFPVLALPLGAWSHLILVLNLPLLLLPPFPPTPIKVPYGDNFYSALRNVINYVSPYETRIKVCGEIRYRKDRPWSITRTLIEKNSYSGMRAYWKLVKEELTKAVDGASESVRFERSPQAQTGPAEVEETIVGTDSVFRHSRHPSGNVDMVRALDLVCFDLDASRCALLPFCPGPSPHDPHLFATPFLRRRCESRRIRRGDLG